MEVVGNDIVAYQKVTKAKVIAGQTLNKPLQDGEGVITKEVAKNLGLQLQDTFEVKGKEKKNKRLKSFRLLSKD